ncbi:MAG: hypothetical protein H8E84_09025 [Flavobacteriales bacterium]|nr:hypothetical protein [Flavobacteriales bacterium]
MNKILILLIFVIGFSSCEKQAGEGGTAIIQGRVMNYSISFNGSSNDTTIFPKSKKDVYIIYSSNENDVYDDNFETNWDGTYRFEFLRKGDYTIFIYQDSTIVGNINYDYPVFKHIEITSNNSTNTLDDFLIFKSDPNL